MKKDSVLLEVKNLSKHYKDSREVIKALDDVSFSLDAGKSIAIIGPSGSGKTTLLEIVSGLNKPTKGKVIIDGLDIHDSSDDETSKFRNQKLGFVFQMMHLQDYFTALENVMLPMLAGNVSFESAKERAIELLNRVNLSKRATNYPSQLSGGEMQRVAIARALANSPKIIMADEPTGKLDRKNADTVMSILKEVEDLGVSVLVITHDEKIASRYTRVLELSHGKIKK